MVFKNNKKKGQAAIEFLMTYGWMLLIVLIVGALVFSFVDFGNLLPSKVELSNNLRASSAESFAYSGNTNNVKVVFTYSGSQKVTISANAGNIIPDVGDKCTSVSVKNVDTDSGLSPVVFLNGHTGVMTFNCNGLLVEDTLEGKIAINVKNAKTGMSTPSTGNIRLVINDGDFVVIGPEVLSLSTLNPANGVAFTVFTSLTDTGVTGDVYLVPSGAIGDNPSLAQIQLVDDSTDTIAADGSASVTASAAGDYKIFVVDTTAGSIISSPNLVTIS